MLCIHLINLFISANHANAVFPNISIQLDYFWVVKSPKIDILPPSTHTHRAPTHTPTNQIELRYLKKYFTVF